MKKLLPLRLTTFAQGFTLIELLVVISIIAILSVMGIAIYTTAQKQARDGVRKAELTSLANTIESAKDPNHPTGAYTYSSTLFAEDYPQVKPKDPLNSTPTYCINSTIDADSTPPAKPTAGGTWLATTACPQTPLTTSWITLVNSSGGYTTTSSGTTYNPLVYDNPIGTPVEGTRSWIICARLEVPAVDNWFCVTSKR